MVRSVEPKGGGGRAGRAAIEIFETGVRVAVLTRRKGRPVVADLIEVEFPAAPEGQNVSVSTKAQALRDALRASRWKLSTATLVLPKNIVTLRLVTLPSENDAELAEMARFEVQKHIPFNVDRHVIAHAVLSKEGVEGSRALIAAVDQAALEEPLAICRDAKIELTDARVSSLALAEALQLQPPASHAEMTYALVNVGWSTVDITIVSRGIVRFTRSGTLGVTRIAAHCETVLGPGGKLSRDHLAALDALEPQAFFQRRGRPMPRRAQMEPTFVVDDFAEEPPEPEEPAQTTGIDLTGPGGDDSSASPDPEEPAGEIVKWLERLVQEIGRTQTFASREFDCPELEAVYLAGAGAYITNLDAYLKPRLRCPVVVIPRPGTLEFAGGEAGGLQEAWAEFAVPIGAAAGDALPAVNLLPPEYTERLQRRRRRRSLAVAGTLVVLMLAVSGALGVRWAVDQRNQLRELERIDGQLRPRVKRLQDMERRLKEVKKIVLDDLSSSGVLKVITDIDLVRNRKVSFLDYHYYKGEGITLEGHALDNAQIGYFKAKLEKTGLFELVTEKPGGPVPLPRGRPTVYRYNFDCRFPESRKR